MITRHRGFVVGSVMPQGKQRVWSVRVKDQTSRYDGQKIVVASIRGELELARGLNVSFVIGTIDDQSGNQVLRAIDVRVEDPVNQSTQSTSQEAEQNELSSDRNREDEDLCS